MNMLNHIKESLLHLAFPHICEGCGSDAIQPAHLLCLRCLSSLPQTNFHLHANNPIEKIFWGRLPLTNATAQFYFTKESLVQQLMHQFKYRSNKELGFYMGEIMGHALLATNRFSYLDALIPLPLFAAKERKRGFNQATILCEGISSVLKKPILQNVIGRRMHTETQTKKGRIGRWQNMDQKFELKRPFDISGKHVLLVDDVITTGATLEACGRELMKAENLQLSVATLCFSSGN